MTLVKRAKRLDVGRQDKAGFNKPVRTDRYVQLSDATCCASQDDMVNRH
jgi:hypothetical protein